MAYSVFAQKRRRPFPASVSPPFDSHFDRAVRLLYQWRARITKGRRPGFMEKTDGRSERPKTTSKVTINSMAAWERVKLTSWKARGLLRDDGSLRCQPVKPPPSVRKLRILFHGLELEDARAIRRRMSLG